MSLHRGWTDERTNALRRYWREGYSASQIARLLGGLTRNAVIGKIHRLGLAGRATPDRPARRKPGADRRTERRQAYRPERFVSRTPAPRVERSDAQPDAPLHLPLASLGAIGSMRCRAVSDDSVWGKPRYCGQRTVTAAESFCIACSLRFYQPEIKQPRKRIAQMPVSMSRREIRP